MKLTYETILTILSSKYILVEGKEKNYFLDSSKRVVANIDENTIVMYFTCDSEVIWNHHNTVMVVFTKNAKNKGNIGDQILISGVLGAINDFKLNNDRCLETISNWELDRYTESLGFCRSDAFGSCGSISSRNGLTWEGTATFDICGIVRVNDCRLHRKYEEKGPDEYRNSVDDLTNSGKISFIKKPDYLYSDTLLNRMIDIYVSSSKSLNSIRLRMLYEAKVTLGTLKEAEDLVLSRYDFKIRKCDKSLIKKIH